MAHDGQNMTSSATVVLPDLLDVSSKSLVKLEELFNVAVETVRAKVETNGRVSSKLIEENQTSAHGLAWLATYVEALRQMQKWALLLDADGAFSETEKLIHQIAFGEYLWQVRGGISMSQTEILRLQDIGVSSNAQKAFVSKDVDLLMQQGNTQAARMRLVELMQENNADVTVGASGLDEELEMIRDQFRRYTVDRIEPVAHEWHLKDELIPMEIIEELAELGVFGLTIPEEFDGLGMSKVSMAVVSEELSRGYIGVGSLGTRSEIAAELILCGGTEEQKNALVT
jgi:(2S)-methylsuccinyl-CoA dehydrogenase